MRTTAEVLDIDAERALISAFEQADVPLRRSGALAGQFDADVNGRTIHLAVHGTTLIDAARVRSVTDRPTSRGVVPFVVGDKIVGDARPLLDAEGWGWLDRRGRLHISALGLLVDIDVDPIPRKRPKRRPSAALAARGTQAVAVALLVDPDNPPGVRDLSRATGFAPSTVSRSLAELRSGGFVRRDNRPVTPDLFWALAEHWMPEWIDLATPISADDPLVGALGGHVHDLNEVGWAVSDTRAGLAWHAPVIASAEAAASIYVPDHQTLDRITDAWGHETRSFMVARARVAVAPVRPVTQHRFRRRGEPWPVAHPLFVALDFATDRARGHQILDEWTPEDIPRVW